MHQLVLVGFATLVPFGCLGLLFGLAWLEDTLVEDVKKAERRDVPKPILSIPVQVALPAARITAPEVQKVVTVEAEPATAPDPAGVRAAS